MRWSARRRRQWCPRPSKAGGRAGRLSVDQPVGARGLSIPSSPVFMLKPVEMGGKQSTAARSRTTFPGVSTDDSAVHAAHYGHYRSGVNAMGLRTRSVSSVAGMEPAHPFGLYGGGARSGGGGGGGGRAGDGGEQGSGTGGGGGGVVPGAGPESAGNGYQETGGPGARELQLYLGSRAAAALSDSLPLHLAPRWFSAHSGEWTMTLTLTRSWETLTITWHRETLTLIRLHHRTAQQTTNPNLDNIAHPTLNHSHPAVSTLLTSLSSHTAHPAMRTRLSLLPIKLPPHSQSLCTLSHRPPNCHPAVSILPTPLPTKLPAPLTLCPPHYQSLCAFSHCPLNCHPAASTLPTLLSSHSSHPTISTLPTKLSNLLQTTLPTPITAHSHTAFQTAILLSSYCPLLCQHTALPVPRAVPLSTFRSHCPPHFRPQCL